MLSDGCVAFFFMMNIGLNDPLRGTGPDTSASVCVFMYVCVILGITRRKQQEVPVQ